MAIIAIRHGLSEANNRENYGTPAFGNPDAPLMLAGKEQSIKLGKELIAKCGADIMNEPVAVSEMLRTHETATYAGFRTATRYLELNEEKGSLNDAEIIEALKTRKPPEAARRAARFLIENPPQEKIWITHALLIATICQELNVYQDEQFRFTPRFCEIRELPI